MRNRPPASSPRWSVSSFGQCVRGGRQLAAPLAPPQCARFDRVAWPNHRVHQRPDPARCHEVHVAGAVKLTGVEVEHDDHGAARGAHEGIEAGTAINRAAPPPRGARQRSRPYPETHPT